MHAWRPMGFMYGEKQGTGVGGDPTGRKKPVSGGETGRKAVGRGVPASSRLDLFAVRAGGLQLQDAVPVIMDWDFCLPSCKFQLFTDTSLPANNVNNLTFPSLEPRQDHGEKPVTVPRRGKFFPSAGK